MGRNKLQVNISRLMALCLAVVLLLPLIPSASAVSGTCGRDVAWSLEGGTLTVYGSGAMEDYSEELPAPWAQFADQISAVVVKQGVESVGAFTFFGMKNVKTVTLANSVRTVKEFAFCGCEQLKMLNMAGVTEIGASAFERCAALKTVRLPSVLQTIRARAFYRCESLLSVTVPASVTTMEGSVFAYCHQLRVANIMANISALPYWTFYGCYELKTVRLQKNIAGLGESSLEGTKVETPEHTDKVPDTAFSDTKTEETEGATVTTDTSYKEDKNASVNTVVTTVKKENQTETSLQIDAVLESDKGWNAVTDAVNENRYGTTNVQANVWLKGSAKVSGSDLGRFAGSDVQLTIYTEQGAQWFIDGKNLAAEKLAKEYDLSYTLQEVTEPDEKQAATLSGHKGYTLRFHASLDFKVEVEILLPREYCRQSAVFFTPEGDGYERRQAVMIDQTGTAHFYLGQVDKNVDYLIGINVPRKEDQGSQNSLSDVIIPDSMKHEYPNLEQMEEVTYIITGTSSSLGINIGQLTIILVAVMVTSAVVIAIIMRMNFKRKLKAGYVPDMSYEEENDQ